MPTPAVEDPYKSLFATLGKNHKPVPEEDQYSDLFATLSPEKDVEKPAKADNYEELFQTLKAPQKADSYEELFNTLKPSQPASPTPQAAGGSAIQQRQGAGVSPDFSQAFQTQTTPDGLVLGTFNSRFFNMPNYTLEQAKQIADKIKQSGANVIALQEIEGNAAMDNLMMPNFPGWQYKMNDTPDQQDLAFMWNPEAVTMNGEPLVYYADEVQPSDPNQKVFQRAPLVAEFIDKRTGTPFKMGNVHLKSQYVPQGVTKEEAAQLKDRDDILRAYQISKLNELKDRLGKDGMPVFIPGDYNFNVAGTSSRNRAMRRGIDYKIKALENARGATDRHYSYDTGRYGQQLDVIGYHNVSPSELSPAFEVESKIPGVPHGPDHDIVASVWKAVNHDGLSPTDFAANPVTDPDVTAAKTTGHDPAFVNNPYIMDAIRGLESPVQRFDKHLTHARGQELNKSVYPWHYRIEMGRAGRSQHTPTLSQMMFAPASWILDSLKPSERIEKPVLPDNVKKGEGNAFTDFELRDVVPFISSVSSSIPKAIMKSFRPSDELLKGLGKSLKETGLGDFLAFRKWNKHDYDEEQLPTDYDWQPPTEQPMNIEDADNIKNWFVTPADQYEFQKREDPDKRTAEEKWKDFLASDPENSGFDAAPEYDLEGKSPYLKTADAPEGDKDFTPLLHVLNDVAYSAASGFNGWLGNLLNGAGVTAHAVTDPIGKWTGLLNPESTNFLQDAGMAVHRLKDRADREVIDKDALYSQVANQGAMMLPTLMMMAATGGTSAPGTIASAKALSPLGAMARSTLGGSAAQTMSGTGYAYKTARELGGTHQQAMDVAGKAAIAETIMNTAANFLAGPHGLFTAGRLSNNEWLKRFFGAERWIERPFISPYRLFARGTGFRWPRAYIGALKTSRASLDAGLRAYLQAYGRGEITRAAVQSTIPNRQISGDPRSKFIDRLFSKEALPTGEKLKALIPAFYSGALSGLLMNLPQITKTFKEGYDQDAALYNRKRADKAQTIRMLEKQQKYLEGIPASERTPLHDQELRAVKYELNNSKSRSPLWETLFPYPSRLRKFHDDMLFAKRGPTPEQAEMWRNQLAKVNSKLGIRLPTQDELTAAVSPKIPGHFTRDKNHHFVKETTATRLGELLEERDYLESSLDRYDHPVRDALRSLNPANLARNILRSQWDKFRDYWDLQPKVLEGTKELRALENSALADLKSNKNRNLTDDDLTKILNTYKNMPSESRENVKQRYYDDLAAQSVARVRTRMRHEEAERYANLEDLNRVLRVRHTLVKGEEPKVERNKLLEALARERAREEIPQLVSKAKIRKDNPEGRDWTQANAIANILAEIPRQKRADTYDRYISDLSYADSPTLRHEIEVAEKHFDRAMREIALREAGVKRPGMLADPRSALSTTAAYQDPLIYLLEALSQRHNYLTSNKVYDAINKVTELTPIQKLIYGK